jgi:hypothetical protein
MMAADRAPEKSPGIFDRRFFLVIDFLPSGKDRWIAYPIFFTACR